jgi:hypothetical protein
VPCGEDARSVADRAAQGPSPGLRNLDPEVVRARRKWDELGPRTRRLIVVAGVIEGALKIAALIDLARRPSSDVRGSKARWAAAVTLINSLGAVPIAYFAWGRRKSGTL